MRRCVIVGGAEINNYDYLRSRLDEDDFFIFCDCGLAHMKGLNVRPDLVVGDFDSYDNPQLSDIPAFRDIEIITLPCEKDDTDTVFAAKEALNRGFDNFLLLGAAGGRLDHTLGNTSILLMLHRAGAKAILIDDYSEMEIVSKEPVLIDDSFDYFSILNIFGPVSGVTETGAKYPLENAVIEADYQYGISNEVAPHRTARVSVEEGELLLIKVF